MSVWSKCWSWYRERFYEKDAIRLQTETAHTPYRRWLCCTENRVLTKPTHKNDQRLIWLANISSFTNRRSVYYTLRGQNPDMWLDEQRKLSFLSSFSSLITEDYSIRCLLLNRCPSRSSFVRLVDCKTMSVSLILDSGRPSVWVTKTRELYSSSSSRNRI